MSKGLYLIPTVKAGRLPIDYTIRYRNIDYRCNFCKQHKNVLIDNPLPLMYLINKYGIIDDHIKSKLTFKDGKTAYLFHKGLKESYGIDMRKVK